MEETNLHFFCTSPQSIHLSFSLKPEIDHIVFVFCCLYALQVLRTYFARRISWWLCPGRCSGAQHDRVSQAFRCLEENTSPSRVCFLGKTIRKGKIFKVPAVEKSTRSPESERVSGSFRLLQLWMMMMVMVEDEAQQDDRKRSSRCQGVSQNQDVARLCGKRCYKSHVRRDKNAHYPPGFGFLWD